MKSERATLKEVLAFLFVMAGYFLLSMISFEKIKHAVAWSALTLMFLIMVRLAYGVSLVKVYSKIAKADKIQAAMIFFIFVFFNVYEGLAEKLLVAVSFSMFVLSFHGWVSRRKLESS
ncbi:hypothetical protein O5O45_08345 [Hahella aquimaris]|uniref:hypothetical protein n=1 Tax=Hahella sp. HNIBRBA332 TaxID=3015983 RepID=UPI00273A9FE0|nr:hypothetical protein [Hahella sp. HNIBRBA332]WLQ15923.1 hypothetical protein O5O45_08345 [Hahella sp. HNIBRBA332]